MKKSELVTKVVQPYDMNSKAEQLFHLSYCSLPSNTFLLRQLLMYMEQSIVVLRYTVRLIVNKRNTFNFGQNWSCQINVSS
jgi:hypothetical protein